MALSDDLGEEQQSYIDSFLFDELTNEQKFPFSVLFDITSVLTGYRSVAESVWQDDYGSDEEMTGFTPEPDSLREFFHKSGIPYIEANRDKPSASDYTTTSTYVIFDSQSYPDAVELLHTFNKTKQEMGSLNYHQTLGDILGYPQFAIEDFEEHGWDEPTEKELIELVKNNDGDLLDLVILFVGLPYSLPNTEDFYSKVYDDAQTYRTSINLYIQGYEYIPELVEQSQRTLIEEIGHRNDFVCEENIVDSDKL
jgi:hypothetical protein